MSVAPLGPPWRDRRLDLVRLGVEESEVEEGAGEGVEEVRVVETGSRRVTGNEWSTKECVNDK